MNADAQLVISNFKKGNLLQDIRGKVDDYEESFTNVATEYSYLLLPFAIWWNCIF